jgi:hypothetical protein
LTSRFTGDVAGSFDALKADWLKGQGLNDEAAKQPFWQGLKTSFESQLQTGKTAASAFKLVMSPISAAFDTGSNAVAKAIGAAAGLGDQDVEKLTKDLSDNLWALGPKDGLGEALNAPKPGATPPGGTPPPPPAAAAPAAPATPPAGRDWLFLGKKLLNVTADVRNATADYLSGKKADNPIQASLDTLSDANGARDVIKDVARTIPDGDVKPDDVLRSAAYTLQRSPDEIMTGLKTALPTDAEILSWKMTMEAGGAQLKQAADAYVAAPTPENFEAAARAFGLSLHMVENWDQVGTEQARAFRARQLAAEGTSEQTKGIMQILQNAGPDNVEDAIRRAAALEDPAKVPGWLNLLRRATSRDSIVASWTNLLLSNVPKTLTKKLFGDAFAAAWQVSTRGIAETAGGVDQGTTLNTLYGYWGAMGDGVRAAGKALRQGGSQFHGEYQTVEGLEKQRLGELAKGMSGADEPTSGAIALLRAALPTDWIGAADDFAKTIHYRAELRRLSWASASKEGLEGDAMNARISELMDVPPPAIHEQALAYALKNSFQEPLPGVMHDLQNGVDRMNWDVGGTGISVPFGRFILPFVKVPSNLVRYAYNASPLPALAPSPAFLAELRAGGSRAALAKASVALGSAVAGIAGSLAYQDSLTGMGPSEPDERRFWLATHQPYSVKLGGTWYGFGGLHPLGMILGAVGDTADVIRYSKQRDAEDAAASIVFGLAHALMEPTFMVGLGDFLEAVNDPTADGRRFMENIAADFAAPQGGVAVDNATDPWRRAHYDLVEAIRARTPGLSKDLPPARTIWGDPLPRAHGWAPWGDAGALGRAFSPVPMRGEDELAQPIDKWIWENRKAFPNDASEGRLGLTPPGQFQTFSSGAVSTPVQLTAQQLDKLRVLAGNGLKDPATKLGAKDALNALVEGKFPIASVQKQWNDGSPELRAIMVQRFWGQYRDGAKKAILREDPELLDTVQNGLRLRAAALSSAQGQSQVKQPVIGAGP